MVFLPAVPERSDFVSNSNLSIRKIALSASVTFTHVFVIFTYGFTCQKLCTNVLYMIQIFFITLALFQLEFCQEKQEINTLEEFMNVTRKVCRMKTIEDLFGEFRVIPHLQPKSEIAKQLFQNLVSEIVKRFLLPNESSEETLLVKREKCREKY